MKQIKLFYGGIDLEALEESVNEFCREVNVIDIKLARGKDNAKTIMVIYEV